MAESSSLKIDRNPDAIRCPFDWPRGLEPDARLLAIKREFAPVLGSPLVYKSELVGLHPKTAFLRANPEDTYGYHVGHPWYGQSRYEWFVGRKEADGRWYPVAPVTGHPGEEGRILLGYLKPDPHAADPDVQKAMNAELEARFEKRAADPEFHKALYRAGMLTSEELAKKLAELQVANPGSATGA